MLRSISNVVGHEVGVHTNTTDACHDPSSSIIVESHLGRLDPGGPLTVEGVDVENLIGQWETRGATTESC